MATGADAALLEGTLRILLLCLAIVAATWGTARWVAWRRGTFESSEPRPDQPQREIHLEPLDIWPEDEPPPPRA